MSRHGRDMTLLTSSAAVAEFCAAAAQEPFMTIDTEFLRESTYWPKLCLIQIGLSDRAVAIDPLAEGIDLAPVWDLLGNPKVLKVFHACKQDMELFLKVTGSLPTPIFDTQVAAMMLGLGEQIGYDSLIQQVLNRQIDKTSQYSDWSLRPLEPQQIAYALGDVTHLYAAYGLLIDDLAQRGRTTWVEEEMKPLGRKETYEVDPDRAWMRLKIKNRTTPFLGALKCLARWRERFAQARDLPRSRVLKDDMLIDLAMRRPKSSEAMMRLRGVGEGLAKGKTGQAILETLREAETLPEHEIPTLPPKPAPVAGAVARGELLRTLLKICANQSRIAPRALASSAELDALARDPEGDFPCLQGWRGELFGTYARNLLRGDLWLGLRNGELAALRPEQI